MTLFLQVKYIEITTKFTENLFFYQFQRNILAQQKLHSSLFLLPLTHDPDTEKITTQNEATTITVLTSPFSWTKYDIETTIKAMIDQPKDFFDKQHEQFDKQN